MPPDVVHVPYASSSQLFAGSAAVVHHGGIGTLSQAVRAGIPQLTRPMAYDQFNDASRACRLVVATELLPRFYRGTVRRGIARTDGELARRTAGEQLTVRIEGQDGLRKACEVLGDATK